MNYNLIYIRLARCIYMITVKPAFCITTLTSLRYWLAVILTLLCTVGFSQNYLGHNREEILLSFPECQVADKYETMVVFNCNGQRSVFYFQAEHQLCDLYASEMDNDKAADTLKYVIAKGFKLIETRYVEPFMVNKKNNHQKFPAKIYSNGKVEYCFMPISLTGRTAEMNSVIIRAIKEKPASVVSH